MYTNVYAMWTCGTHYTKNGWCLSLSLFLFECLVRNKLQIWRLNWKEHTRWTNSTYTWTIEDASLPRALRFNILIPITYCSSLVHSDEGEKDRIWRQTVDSKYKYIEERFVQALKWRHFIVFMLLNDKHPYIKSVRVFIWETWCRRDTEHNTAPVCCTGYK